MGIGYILIDGAADREDPRLNGTTPLHAAMTPNLDKIVSCGSLGKVYTVGRGVSPESDVAVLSMLGYKFGENYPGRGVIEAIGCGIDFREGMLALRANFATVKDGIILDRRAGRDITEEELKELEREISSIKLSNADFTFKATIGHRGVLVIRADTPLSASITNTDPAYKRVKGYGVAVKTEREIKVEMSKPAKEEKGALLASKLVNEFTEKAAEILSKADVNSRRVRSGKLPANFILLRDAGNTVPKVESFEKRFGLKGKALVDMPVEIGIAKLLGLKLVECREKNMEWRAKRFLSEIENCNFVYLHIKGPDEFGHDGDIMGKKKSIEKIDREFFKIVRENQNSRLVVSCDHATPCRLMMHSSDPVPLLITGIHENKAPRFAELYSRHNILGIRQGYQILDKISKLEKGD
jgi:2,3-bisphosphoglycerate-independent phosphoglycerate mutase